MMGRNTPATVETSLRLRPDESYGSSLHRVMSTTLPLPLADSNNFSGKEHTECKISEEELEPYRRLFEKHRGDVRAIFEDLEEDPGKALKYPPKDCEQFATMYVRGGYTYVPDAKAVRK